MLCKSTRRAAGAAATLTTRLFATAVFLAGSCASAAELDTTYANGGVYQGSLTLHSASYGYVPVPLPSVVLADGSVLFVGKGESDGALRVLRLDPDGRPDAQFGDGGIAVAAIDTGSGAQLDENSAGLAVTSNGRIILAGLAPNADPNDNTVRVTRLNGDGSVDRTFAINGFSDRHLGGIASKSVKVAVDASQRTYVYASLEAPTGPGLSAWRLLPDGARDLTYADLAGNSGGQSGLGLLPLSAQIASDGTQVLRVENPLDILDSQSEVRTLKPDGGFGKLLAAVDNASFTAIAVNDAAVYCGKNTWTGEKPIDARISRFTTDGSLDTSFANNGELRLPVLPTSLGLPAGTELEVQAISIDPTGQIFVSGNAGNSQLFRGMVVAHVTSRGALDTAVGDGGFEFIDVGAAPAVASTSRAVGGNIVLAAYRGLGALNRAAPVAARILGAANATARRSPGVVGAAVIQHHQHVWESDGAIAIPVRRTGGTLGAASVNYRTVSGLAQAGSDFEATSGTLYWAAGDDSVRQVVIRLFPNSDLEPSEVFYLQFSDATGASLLEPSRVMLDLRGDNQPLPAAMPSIGSPASASSTGQSGGGGGLGVADLLLLAVLTALGKAHQRRRPFQTRVELTREESAG